jgi:serine/threonine protein kinase
LNHPHICTVHDVGHDDGLHYLVFEYLVGQPLSDRLAEGPLPLTDALQYAIEIADALASAHEAGVIHLDLKPENIMLTRRGLKLVDFGIAELQYPGAEASDTVKVRAGTLGYMPPEQAAGGAVDPRADVFAFGAVLYQMLTGCAAFPTRDVVKSPPPVSEVAPQLPTELNLIVGRCLAHALPDRWPSISDVLLRLRQVREKAPNL